MDHYFQVKTWIKRALLVLSALMLTSLASLEMQYGFFRHYIKKQGAPDKEITSILIERPGHSDISLIKNPSQWLISKPCQLIANENRVEPLLSLAKPAAHQYPAEEVDRDAAGLIQPLAGITLNSDRLLIGNTDLAGDRRYLQRGQRIELVPSWTLDLVNGGLSALASLQVFDKDLQQLAFTHHEGQPPFSTQVEPWQMLTAQQIVEWPLLNNDYTRNATYTASATFTDEISSFELHLYDNFASLVHANANCAFIMAIEELPLMQN